VIEKTAPTNFEILDVLQKRWSPRAFSEKAVSHDILRRILEAARWAPSCFNVQPWRYLVGVKGEGSTYEDMLACLAEKNQQWAQSAPVLMIGLAKKTFEVNDNPNAHAEHDLGLANSQLTIQAQAEGLYVHQMAGINRDKIREVYQVPSDFNPIVGLALGYLGELERIPEGFHDAEKAINDRKPHAEFVFAGKFGDPWS
jgi:nitroreductase